MNLKPSIRIVTWGVVLVAAIAMFALLQPASAQAAAGITVSPAAIKLSLSQTAPQQQTTVTITNGYNVPIRLSAELYAIDETNGRLLPTVLLRGPLQSALTLSETDIAVPASGSRTITVQARNSDTLAPGGHYATIILTQQGSGQQSSLRSALSVTTFVVKQDGVHQELSLDKVNFGHTIFSHPKTVDVTFSNKGNVHAVPRAVVTVQAKNILLYKGVVNEGSLPLLPTKQLTYQARLQELDHVASPSRVVVTVSYRDDTGGLLGETQYTYFYVPPRWLVRVLLLAIVVFVAIHILSKAVQHLSKRRRPTIAASALSRTIVVDSNDQPSEHIAVQRVEKAEPRPEPETQTDQEPAVEPLAEPEVVVTAASKKAQKAPSKTKSSVEKKKKTSKSKKSKKVAK